MIQCSICFGFIPNDAMFCIECGKRISAPYTSVANTGITTRVNDISDINIKEVFVKYLERDGEYYFIYRKDLPALLRDTNTYVMGSIFSTEEKIFYYGREVLFID